MVPGGLRVMTGGIASDDRYFGQTTPWFCLVTGASPL